MTSKEKEFPLFPRIVIPKSPRFKDPFLDLDEYKKAPEIKISSCNIGNFYANPTLFNGILPQHGLRGISGRYFELVARAIYSGTIRTTHELKQGETTVTCEPDITHNTPLKREVKSVCTGEWLKLSDEQVAKYCIIQARKLGCESRGGYSLLPFKEDIYPLLTYEIFRHCLRKMNEKCRNKTHHDLISMLTKSGRFLISLPFSILYQIHTIQKKGYTSRYDGERYETMTRVNSPALNSLLASPETTLEELCINPNDYTFERFRLPAKIHINGDEISSFPILVVRDKNHLNWAELFDREYYEKLREAREQVGTINNSRDMTPLFRASLDILDNEKDNKPEEDSANISDPLPTKPDDNIPF